MTAGRRGAGGSSPPRPAQPPLQTELTQGQHPAAHSGGPPGSRVCLSARQGPRSWGRAGILHPARRPHSQLRGNPSRSFQSRSRLQPPPRGPSLKFRVRTPLPSLLPRSPVLSQLPFTASPPVLLQAEGTGHCGAPSQEDPRMAVKAGRGHPLLSPATEGGPVTPHAAARCS